METRQINQVRVYKLILNPMAGCSEAGELVAFSTDYDKLVNWYNSQRAAEPYRDGHWWKVFAPGTPLEWYNPADWLELNNLGLFGHGIADEWINEEVFLDVSTSGRLYFVD